MFGDFTRSFVLSFLRQKNVFVLMFTLFVYLGGGGDSLFVVDFPFYLSSKDHQDDDDDNDDGGGGGDTQSCEWVEHPTDL